jgi:hypothetical protein
MGETIELENFDINLNDEISINDLSSGNAECGMCETIFKVDGIDAIKITAVLD